MALDASVSEASVFAAAATIEDAAADVSASFDSVFADAAAMAIVAAADVVSAVSVGVAAAPSAAIHPRRTRRLSMTIVPSIPNAGNSTTQETPAALKRQ